MSFFLALILLTMLTECLPYVPDAFSWFLGSYEDPFAIIGGVRLSACQVSRGLLGGIQ